jgi:hypothetical protein
LSRAEDRLRLSENRVLRKTLGFETEERTGEWRRLHSEDLYDLYSSSNIIRVIKSRIRLVRHVAHMEARRGAYRVLVGNPEG